MDARQQATSKIAQVLASFDDRPLPAGADHALDLLRHDEVQMPYSFYLGQAARIVDALEQDGIQLAIAA